MDPDAVPRVYRVVYMPPLPTLGICLPASLYASLYHPGYTLYTLRYTLVHTVLAGCTVVYRQGPGLSPEI